MNRGKRRTLGVGAILISIAVGVSYVAAGSQVQQQSQPGPGNPQQKAQVGRQAALGQDTIHSTQLPAAQKMIERAIQHLEAGRQQEALSELRNAQTSLEAVRQSLGKHIEPPIVNARCPIMGSRINAGRVSASLTRMYDGQKVAFCCAGCPGVWDQLDDAQKAAKLASAIGVSGRSQVQPKKAPAAPSQQGSSCEH